ncbi:MAG TPA: PilZ domain-containing protein [Pilimelia sp.]|nr:PilZ domain-containing protein [Pilimelia sp.]
MNPVMDRLPVLHARIELAVLGGNTYASRVEDIDGRRLTVAAPLNLLVSEVPADGTELTLFWSGSRGRHWVPGRLVRIDRAHVTTWLVELTGEVTVQQRRGYVRGGGGEPVRVRRELTPDDRPVEGHVVDVSERSVRARLPRLTVKAGDPVTVRLVLDEDVVEVTGSVLRVVEHAQPGGGVDVVAVYDPPESQASLIRRYVLRSQMLARARIDHG